MNARLKNGSQLIKVMIEWNIENVFWGILSSNSLFVRGKKNNPVCNGKKKALMVGFV